MNKEDNKTLSVITPVFNRADCIEQCMHSVASQEVPEGWQIEHVIVDDGSSDNTLEVINSNATELVQVESFAHNRGTNAARNAAIKHAKGRWVIILDSDDIMLPGAVAEICRTIDANPDIKHFTFSTDDTADYHKTMLGQTYTLGFEDFLLEKVFGDFVHVMLRSTVLAHPFEEKLRIHEGIFFLHYYRSAERILFTNKVLYHRDRGRTDHVTFELHLTNNRALKTKREAINLRIRDFGDDYAKTPEGVAIMNRYLQTLYRLDVLSGEYDQAKELEQRIQKPDSKYAILHRLRLGKLAWLVMKPLVRLKHSLKH